MIKKHILKNIFGERRILALAGNTNSGKTNNLIFLINTLPKEKLSNVYFYGLPRSVASYLIKKGCNEIDDLKQLVGKEGCLIILDEFQKLHINDRRNKHVLSQIVDFIHHNKNRIILSSPNIREFNSIIGGVIEGWLLKSVHMSDCVNGSQLKKVVTDYKGHHKQLDDIVTKKSEMIVINNERAFIIECDYVEIADSKKNDGVQDFF